MKIMNKFIAQLNLIQKTLLTIASSIVTYWLLDGFNAKPLEDVIFKFINIVLFELIFFDKSEGSIPCVRKEFY